MPLNVPDHVGKTFRVWSNEFYTENFSPTFPLPPADEASWRAWADFIVADFLEYPSASGYYSWKSWVDALIAIEI